MTQVGSFIIRIGFLNFPKNTNLMKYSRLMVLLLLTLLSKVGLAQEYAITNIHVISMEDDKIQRDHYIHVKDGKIVEIGPMSNSTRIEGIQKSSGNGAYAFPGLAEMHSHIPITEDNDFSYVQDVMWLYLANGILNVRGMIGHPSHLELKKKIRTGELLGPRIFAAGPSLNGGTVESPEHGIEMVKQQKKAGYDHLKLHPGLDMPRYEAISNTAKEEDIYFGGHVSLDVGLHASLQRGYRSVEHMDGYIEALVSDRERHDPTIAGPFGMLLVEEADHSLIPALVQKTLEHQAWIAPTMTLFERFFGYIPADEFRLAPEMKYMPGIQVQQWVNQKKLLESQGVLKEAHVKPYLEFRKKMLLALHKGGVPIIMASDSPQVFNVPGFSIHHEIAAMQEAGIHPYEILKTGSVNVARYFEQEGEYGVLKEGAAADFVLLEANPLENLQALKLIREVVVNGKRLERKQLEEALLAIEQKNQRK
jgi:hypothetical protein